VDLASLPPIESLTSESDLTVFLQTGVPMDLVRAALRHAWRMDPGIRDFVGIAESQWDFNDPDAMPGFGPLEATGGAPGVVMRSAAPAAPPAPASELRTEAWQDPNPHRDGHLDPVWLSGEQSQENLQGKEADHPHDIPAASGVHVPGAPRRHGSALPKPR
jgi:hypothetical protein